MQMKGAVRDSDESVKEEDFARDAIPKSNGFRV